MKLEGEFNGWETIEPYHAADELGEVWMQNKQGVRLNEYQPTSRPGADPVWNPPIRECYVECEEGQEFSVTIRKPDNWGLSRPRPMEQNADYLAHMFADGRRLTGRVTRFWESSTTHLRTGLEEKGGQWYETTFKFSPISLTDDLNRATKEKSVLEGLGTVRVDLWFGRDGGPMPGPPFATEALALKPIHEKSKKGMIGQTVGAGETRPIPVPGSVKFTKRNYIRPDCRVIFQYRTSGLLMARRIIEPPHGSAGPHDQGPRMKRNRRDSSETVVRGRQDQPRRSKRIKEHEAQVTMLRNNPCKVEHVIEELARSSKDQPIDLTED